MSKLFAPARAATTLLLAVLLAGCVESTDPDCDIRCDMQNGASASTQTSYWLIPSLTQGGNHSARLAFFADGTGKIVAHTNNCTVPIGSGATSNPMVITFTYTANGTSLLLSEATFRCTYDPSNARGSVTSLTSIVGGVSSGTFSAVIFADWFMGGGNFQGNLVAGSF